MNQLEQLCVNLCSETLQHFYNTHIFKSREEYSRYCFKSVFLFKLRLDFFLTFPSLGRIQDPSLNFFTSLHSTGKTVFFQILEWIILITLRALSYSLARYVKKCLRAILKTFSKNVESDSGVHWFASLLSKTGQGNSRRFPSQSGAKMKQSASWLFAFSCVWSALCFLLLAQKLLAIFLTNQMQKWNKPRHGRPRFSALDDICI